MWKVGETYVPLRALWLAEVRAAFLLGCLSILACVTFAVRWTCEVTVAGCAAWVACICVGCRVQRWAASGAPLSLRGAPARLISPPRMAGACRLQPTWLSRCGAPPTAVIVGATRGYGRHVVQELALHGCDVVVCNPFKMQTERVLEDIETIIALQQRIHHPDERSRIVSLTHRDLDLSCERSVRQCAADILLTNKRINVLISLVDVAHASGTTSHAVSDSDALLLVNFLGPALFTELLLERILHSTPARIVLVASLAHLSASVPEEYSPLTALMEYCSPRPWISTGTYCLAHLLTLCYSHDLAARLRDSGVLVCACHPGMLTDTMQRRLRLPLAVAGLLLPLLCKQPWEGARTVIHCAVSDDVVSSAYYADGAAAEGIRSPLSWDPAINAKLVRFLRERYHLH